MIDLDTLSDAELGELDKKVEAELQRRYTVATAPQQVAAINEQVYAARGGDGRPWARPTGAHDAYPLGAVVALDGTQYRSLIAANVWSPADYPAGWEKLTSDEVTEPEPQPTAPTWKPDETVKVGDRRTHQGATYVCVQAHTTQAGWTPDVVAALWSRA